MALTIMYTRSIYCVNILLEGLIRAVSADIIEFNC